MDCQHCPGELEITADDLHHCPACGCYYTGRTTDRLALDPAHTACKVAQLKAQTERELAEADAEEVAEAEAEEEAAPEEAGDGAVSDEIETPPVRGRGSRVR